MGNAVSFRLNPKCESDRKILAWLEEKSSQPGYLNQTELIKQALFSAMESEQRGIWEKETTEWMEQAIKSVAEEFTKVVQESSQNVANSMFASVLGAMAQQMNMGAVTIAPMQMAGAVPNGMTVAVPNVMQVPIMVPVSESSLPDNELATDISNGMDNATKSMLGSLFDMDDE
jgi:PAB1-binding protein PBP1